MQYDTSKLDQEGVKASQRGQNWDQNDQARYDKWAEAKDRAGNYKPAVEPFKPGDQVIGEQDLKPEDGSKHPGFNDQGKVKGPEYQVTQAVMPGGRHLTEKELAADVKAAEASVNQGKLAVMPNKSQMVQGGRRAQQNVNQKNGIKSNVNGDNNYVYNNQDNSVRHYGGDNRSFVYNSNSEGPDTPATMATLAGYYAPDDSHGAQAARFDRNVTMNRDAQKKYANTSHIAQGAIKRAEQNAYINPRSLDKRIADRSKYHMAESTIKGAEIFGDIYGLESPTWNSSKPAKPVEKPDFKKMYDTYTDF